MPIGVAKMARPIAASAVRPAHRHRVLPDADRRARSARGALRGGRGAAAKCEPSDRLPGVLCCRESDRVAASSVGEDPLRPVSHRAETPVEAPARRAVARAQTR